MDPPPPCGLLPVELAQNVVDSGAVPLLVICVQEPELSLKCIATSTLSDICKHGPEVRTAPFSLSLPLFSTLRRLTLCGVLLPHCNLCLNDPFPTNLLFVLQLAQAVVDNGAIAYIAPLIQSPDAKLKRQVCSCLSQIARHNFDLAELVVEGEIFPKIFNLLKDVDQVVRKNAATCIREVCKHTPEV